MEGLSRLIVRSALSGFARNAWHYLIFPFVVSLYLCLLGYFFCTLVDRAYAADLVTILHSIATFSKSTWLLFVNFFYGREDHQLFLGWSDGCKIRETGSALLGE